MRRNSMGEGVQSLPPSLTLPLKGGGKWSEAGATAQFSSPSPLEGEGRGGGYASHRSQFIRSGVSQ